MAEVDVFRQIELLSIELGNMQPDMIDPRDFGKLEGQVSAVTAALEVMRVTQAQQNARVEAEQKVIADKIDMVLTQMSEAKGGWKTLMLLGGAGATFGAVASWALTSLPFFKP